MTSLSLPPTTLTARSPEDLLAVARVVLGFDPDDSVVMLTFGGPGPFHARVDLPPPRCAADELALLADTLLRPALRHRVEATVLLVFGDDDRTARRAVRAVTRSLEGAGIACLEAIRAHAGRWHPLHGRLRGAGSAGVTYDVTAHPFVVDAVLRGRVIHGSRAELAATLDADPELSAAVTRCRPAAAASPEWAAATARHHALAGTVPPAPEAARLLEAVAEQSVRDAVWGDVERGEARHHVELWSALVRRAPDDLVAHAAAVLAFVAWLSGDGALAWCGVDRARAACPDHSLAALVASALEGAVPPSSWDDVGAGVDPAS
ncbi:hypothetical protein GCM10009623_02420 [Nocardioides aestuarii]|uniref:DUF4192 domain-containing protein n=1 Tax=Nocardioides aestuarii TaxID=252231 RepID=A0ABW4TJJ7_9ACTN